MIGRIVAFFRRRRRKDLHLIGCANGMTEGIVYASFSQPRGGYPDTSGNVGGMEAARSKSWDPPFKPKLA